MFFTLIASLGAGLLFGLGPALSSVGFNLHDVLKEAGRGSHGHRVARRSRQVLVAVELALALVLLTGAGLLAKSFWRMNVRTAGFDPAQILTMRVRHSGPRYGTPQALGSYVRQVLERLDGAPGVESVGVTGPRGRYVVRREGVPPYPPGPPSICADCFAFSVM